MNQPLPNQYMSAKQLSCTYGDPFIAYCHMKHKHLMPHGQSALWNKRSLEFFLLQVKCRLICIALVRHPASVCIFPPMFDTMPSNLAFQRAFSLRKSNSILTNGLILL